MFDSILSFFLSSASVVFFVGFLLGLAVASIICYKILTDRAKVQEESLKEKDRLLHDQELKYKSLFNDKDLARHNMQEAFVNVFGSEK